MLETIEFRDRYGGLSAKIEIFGSADRVTIELNRDNRKITITKNYGIIEGIIHPWIFASIPGSAFPSENKQLWFESRIRETVKQYSDIAKRYIKKDEEQASRIIEARKTEEEKNNDLKQFVGEIKSEFGGKSESTELITIG